MYILKSENVFRGPVPIVVHRDINPTAASTRHAHDFFEVVFLACGSARHHTGRHCYPVFAGDVFVVDIGEPHYYSNPLHMELWYINANVDWLKEHVRRLKDIEGFQDFFCMEPLFRTKTKFGHRLHLEEQDAQKVLGHLQRMESELRDQRSGFEVIVEALFLEFLVLISRLYHGYSHAHLPVGEMACRRRAVNKVLAYMHEHYTDDIHLVDLARCGCLQSQYLCRVFKLAMGMSMVKYLNRFRIDRACQLLKQTDQNITEICYSVGFRDLSYFTRFFHKAVGATPRAFRNKSKLS